MDVSRQADVPLTGACHRRDTNMRTRLMDDEKCSKTNSFIGFDTASTITLIRRWDPNFYPHADRGLDRGDICFGPEQYKRTTTAFSMSFPTY